MYIKKLELQNIRSYKSQIINFPKGSLLLSGDIGSGKSTLLQAIDFALFGTQRGHLEASQLQRKGELNSEVTLTFEIDGKEVIINRSLKKGQQKAGYLIEENLKENLMATELNSRILDILGYPSSEIFLYSVYASQEQMKAIILEKPEPRLKTLRKIFGVDKYMTIVENSIKIARELKKKAIYFESSAGEVDSRTEMLKLARLKLEKTKKVCGEKEKDLKQFKDLVQNSEKEFKKKLEDFNILLNNKKELELLGEVISNLKKNLVDKEKLISKLDSEILEISEKLKEFDSFNFTFDERINDEIKAQESMLERNKNIKNKLQFEITKLNEKLVELKTIKFYDVSKLDSEIGEIKSRIDDFEKNKLEIDLKKEELVMKETQLKNLLQQKTKFSSLDTCPTCMQEVSTSHKDLLMKELEPKILLLNTEVQKIKDLLSKFDADEIVKLRNSFLNKSEEKVKAEQNNLQYETQQENRSLIENELKNKISTLDKILEWDFEKNEKILSSLKQKKEEQFKLSLKFEELKGMKENLKIRADLLSRSKDEKLEIERKIKEMAIKMDSLKNTLLGFEELELSLKSSETLFQKNSDSYQKIKIKYAELAKDLEFSEKELFDAKKNLEVVSLAKKKFDYYIQLRDWLLDFFIPLMKTIEKKVLLEIHREFTINFSDWFDILIEDDEMTVVVDESFTPVIRQGDYDLDLNSLSGGERTSVALAYRLALNRIVNELIPTMKTKNILILDEPTEGFSTEQLDRVKVVLDLLRVSQLIIVSHEQKIDGFVENLIRIEKEQNISYLAS